MRFAILLVIAFLISAVFAVVALDLSPLSAKIAPLGSLEGMSRKLYQREIMDNTITFRPGSRII